MVPLKAQPNDFLGRFREVISDPLNLLIERVPMAGFVNGNHVYLHNGNRVPIAGEGAYYGPFSQLLIINRGVHEPLEEYVFQQLLKLLGEAPVMLELGAYWGHYSMWLKKVRARSTVILVEPDPANLTAGISNFKINGFTGEFIQSAVGRGHLQVDSFRADRRLGRLNILHVDIQGYEVEMLEGCRRSLAERSVDYVFISTHSQPIHEHIVAEMCKLGYRIEVSSDFDSETTSYDGLVFASNPDMAPIFETFKPIGRTKITKSSPHDLLTALSGVTISRNAKRDSSNAAQKDMADVHDALRLRLHDDLIIAVPRTLSAITTYVLLEQEKWFEKEVNFVRGFLKPGMTVIDVGANLGVYSLVSARLVGPEGRVFSYEPGGEARALLEQSLVLNSFTNMEIIGAALSNSTRDGHLAFAPSSELRAVGTDASGEPIRITCLDVEARKRDWPSIDFIKIDAEGEEERIIAGGRSFFADQSPLVMFEIKAGNKINERLRTIFRQIGYRLFRQLGGAPILVPDNALPIDGYELNLFAAKPDRVSALSKCGLLVEVMPDWAPNDDDRKNALSFWRRQKFAPLADSKSLTTVDSGYLNGLAAYAIWRNVDQPIATRCAALAFALQSLRAICARECTVERISTWARIAWEWGARAESVTALQRLLRILTIKPVPLSEPFFPASARFDNIEPGEQLGNWFVASAVEQFEQSSSFSSVFGGASPGLTWLCSQPFACAEMERRRTLLAARSGQGPRVPERLCIAEKDHLNADVWRAGLVPGTVVGP